MAPLPGPNANATCSYNGVSFTTLYKTSVSSKPILDEARRTTVYVEYTLTVQGYIVSLPTDVPLATMRKLLSAVGGALVYQNKGFGDLVVNGLAVVRDAAWGPIPDILEWQPLGGDCNAAKVTWRVVTRIPECDSARYRFAVLALNYEATFDIDESGYTSYRLAGYIEIPMTRPTQSTRTLPDNVDKYRELLRPPVALGFQRKSQDYRVSKDKRRLDFTIVDEEMPSPFPDGVTRCEARHSIRSGLHQGAFRVWTTTIEATITLARGLPKTDALAKFLLIVSSRIGAQGKGVHIPQDITFEDDIFGRTARFTLTLRGFFHLTIQEALNASAMWRPIAGTSYSSWRASLEQAGASGVRGYAGAQNLPGSDAIIDLCLGQTSNVLKTMQLPNAVPQAGSLVNQQDPFEPTLRTLSPDDSWLFYRPSVRWLEASNVVRHKPMPSPPASSGTDFTTLTTGGVGGAALLTQQITAAGVDANAIEDARGAVLVADPSRAYPPDVFQRTAAPQRTLIFSGVAARLAYRIPVPTLSTVGGVPVVEVRRDVQEFQPGGYGNVLVFGLRWEIEYSVPTAPQGNMLYTANPEFGTDGGQGVVGPLKP